MNICQDCGQLVGLLPGEKICQPCKDYMQQRVDRLMDRAKTLEEKSKTFDASAFRLIVHGNGFRYHEVAKMLKISNSEYLRKENGKEPFHLMEVMEMIWHRVLTRQQAERVGLEVR